MSEEIKNKMNLNSLASVGTSQNRKRVGRALVPSGKIINETPLASFIEPSFITFLRLTSFFDLFKCIGLRQANAHPKKGI